MRGEWVGYIRVSSGDQNPERQLDGAHLDRVFTDHASGKDVQLAALLDFVIRIQPRKPVGLPSG